VCNYSTQLKLRKRRVYGTLRIQSQRCSNKDWSAWRLLSSCNKRCGGGMQTFVRTCNGQSCIKRNDYIHTICNTQSCF
jgi:hypothetical protein